MARKTIWYKRAVLGTVQNRNLQAALTTALTRLPTTGDRLRRPGGPAEPGRELINGHARRYSMLCGHFISFEAGHRQLFLHGLDTATSFDLDAIAPPTGQPEERREFLEGVAYFAIHGNHVLLCQSKAAGSRELESYLNWILWGATTVLPNPTAVVLADQPSNRLVDKLNRNPIKSVRFGTPLDYEAIAAPETRNRVTSVRVSPKGLGADIIQALLSDSIFDHAGFSDAIRDDNIEVEVTVRFKHKQQISDSGDDLLRSVAKAARHMNPEDVEIELHHAGIITGNELRVYKSMGVPTTDSGLIREDDLNQQMATWLQDLLESKMIDP
jgi:hypothetical protein